MTTTPNYNFELIAFDQIPWHEKEHDNWSLLDALLARYVSISNVQGVWQNALAVTVGQKYIDSDLGTIWEVLVAHTTPSTGTFAASRSATSTNWQSFTVEVTNQGTWTTATVYSPNDFVVDTNRYGIVTTAYTSGASYDIDVTAGNIVTLIDTSTVATDVAAAAASASAASTSETNASTSETNAAASESAASTSETNAGTSETNASSSASAASTSETNAGTSETNAGTSETNAAASASAAATSETNAATSETNAAASAASLPTISGGDATKMLRVNAGETGYDFRTVAQVLSDIGAQADLAVPSQAEAEAGTATTERVWTAQRVSQAIAALAAGGGAWTLIGTATASSSASLTITGLDATYDTYVIIGADLVPATDAVVGWLRIGDSSGVDSGASDYNWFATGGYRPSGAATGVAAPTHSKDNADAQIEMSVQGVGNAATESLSFYAFLHSPRGNGYPHIRGTTFYSPDAVGESTEFGGTRNSLITTDRMNFQFASGNIASGRITVWGIAHA